MRKFAANWDKEIGKKVSNKAILVERLSLSRVKELKEFISLIEAKYSVHDKKCNEQNAKERKYR